MNTTEDDGKETGTETTETAEETTETTETTEEGDKGGEGGEGGDPDDKGEGDDVPEAEKKSWGEGTKKRFEKLNGQKKDAERRVSELTAELAKSQEMGGENGKYYVKAAESAGVLPQMMTAAEAKGLADLDDAQLKADFLKRKLRNTDGDEIQIGDGEPKSRRAVQNMLDDATDDVAKLEKRFGSVRDRLQKQAKELIELGMAAKKANWKPGKKAPKDDDDDEGKGKAAAGAGAGKPKPKTSARKTPETEGDEEVGDVNDLAASIERDRAEK